MQLDTGAISTLMDTRLPRFSPGKKILNGQWPSMSSSTVGGWGRKYFVMRLVSNLFCFLSACLCKALVFRIHVAMSPSHDVSYAVIHQCGPDPSGRVVSCVLFSLPHVPVDVCAYSKLDRYVFLQKCRHTLDAKDLSRMW